MCLRRDIYLLVFTLYSRPFSQYLVILMKNLRGNEIESCSSNSKCVHLAILAKFRSSFVFELQWLCAKETLHDTWKPIGKLLSVRTFYLSLRSCLSNWVRATRKNVFYYITNNGHVAFGVFHWSFWSAISEQLPWKMSFSSNREESPTLFLRITSINYLLVIII